MKLFNTLTRNKEEFKSIKPGIVNMYVCGPTVNDVPHLGHARQQITYDILRSYLEFKGFEVVLVSNITDVDDKIINKARELGVSIKELTEKNVRAHMKDYESIGVRPPTFQPRATEHISDMIDLITQLEEKGFTYVIKEDGIYYDVSKFIEYGKLSGQNIASLKSGARVKSNTNKKNSEDFVLWKFSKKGEPSWHTKWGDGRPGWHIECSAMSHSFLGLPLDIHGGGQDLIFPHHEDEIAQSKAAYGVDLAKFWVHNGMVNVDSIKMSKSLGNFRTIKDLLEEYPGEVIRYFVLLSHYRKPINFSANSLDNAKNSYNKIKKLIQLIPKEDGINEDYLLRFEKSMDDDLNTSKALVVLHDIVKDKDAKNRYDTILKIDSVLNLKLLEFEKNEIPENIYSLAKQREEYREKKEWKNADDLRDKVSELGYVINDTSEGFEIENIFISSNLMIFLNLSP